jgi:hypothetical protein
MSNTATKTTNFDRQPADNQSVSKKRSISKTLLRRIDKVSEIVNLYRRTRHLFNEVPSTYAGSTMVSYINVVRIKTKSQFVYIETNFSDYNEVLQDGYRFERRYNVNKDFDLDSLKYDLNIINRTYRKFLKRQLEILNSYDRNLFELSNCIEKAY